MIPTGSQVIIVEANEPGDLLPASVTWQLVGTQEPGPGKKVSRCSKTPGWAWVGGTRPWHGVAICVLEGVIITVPRVCFEHDMVQTLPHIIVPWGSLQTWYCRPKQLSQSP